jgi:hypothetical protein
MANLRISALPAASTPLAGTELVPIVQGGITEQVSVANLTAGRAVSLGVSTITGPDQVTANINTASNIDAEITSTGSSPASGGSLVFSAASGAWKFAAIKALATNGGGNSQGDLSIGTRRVAADATLTEAIKFHSSGGISINSAIDPAVGNLALGTGNLIISTSGKGIDFSATAGTGTSELLADYEEGTWTPTITPSTSGAVTYTTQNGTYTKVGRQVTIVFIVAGTKNTASGEFRVGGIPFNISGSAITGAINWYNPSGTALVNAVAFYFSSTLFRIGVITAANTDATAGSFSSAEVSSTFSLTGTLTYFV